MSISEANIILAMSNKRPKWKKRKYEINRQNAVEVAYYCRGLMEPRLRALQGVGGSLCLEAGVWRSRTLGPGVDNALFVQISSPR